MNGKDEAGDLRDIGIALAGAVRVSQAHDQEIADPDRLLVARRLRAAVDREARRIAALRGEDVPVQAAPGRGDASGDVPGVGEPRRLPAQGQVELRLVRAAVEVHRKLRRVDVGRVVRFGGTGMRRRRIAKVIPPPDVESIRHGPVETAGWGLEWRVDVVDGLW